MFLGDGLQRQLQLRRLLNFLSRGEVLDEVDLDLFVAAVHLHHLIVPWDHPRRDVLSGVQNRRVVYVEQLVVHYVAAGLEALPIFLGLEAALAPIGVEQVGLLVERQPVMLAPLYPLSLVFVQSFEFSLFNYESLLDDLFAARKA